MTTQLSIQSPIVNILNNVVTTSSFNVADYFGKQHKNVIQKIESLDCSEEFMTANFSAVVRNVKAGFHERQEKYYQMTKDGFIFLVMGFTGKKAAQFKEAYIKAFNEMERLLLNKPESLIPHDKIAVSRTNLKCLVSHMIWLKEFYFSNNLYNTFGALNSDFGVRMHDHIKDGYCVAWSFKQDLQM
ncbi:hypothetical protein DKL61_09255 [Gammaproteobacteria bacterium ESL0073]|nr:hypothetical protein DKL61_09255 [Gammaproteobacteria bacterium ESL0073]